MAAKETLEKNKMYYLIKEARQGKKLVEYETLKNIKKNISCHTV